MNRPLHSTATVSLKDVAVLNPQTPRLSPTEGVAFVPMASVSEEGSMAAETASVADLKPGFSYFKNGDVLVAKITPCYENNKITIASFTQQHGFGSTEFHVLRPASGALDSSYLVHYLRQDSIRRAGERRMTGSGGQRRVPRQFLEELPIPLPPIDEQRRIAAILDQADDLRRKRRAVLERLDALASACFASAFPHLSWSDDVQPIAGLLSMPLRNGVSPSSNGSVLCEVLTLSAVTGSEFNLKAIKEGLFDTQPLNEKHASDVDFLICRGNGNLALVGRGFFAKGLANETVFPDTMIAARFKPDVIEPGYVQHIWHMPEVRSQIERYARTTNGTYKVNQTAIEAISVPVPSLSLQHKFANSLFWIAQAKASHSAHLAKLDALFASLQHRAFRGEL